MLNQFSYSIGAFDLRANLQSSGGSTSDLVIGAYFESTLRCAVTVDRGSQIGEFVRDSSQFWPIGWNETLSDHIIDNLSTFYDAARTSCDERSRGYIYDKSTKITYGLRRAGNTLYISSDYVDDEDGITIRCARYSTNEASHPFGVTSSDALHFRDGVVEMFKSKFAVYHNPADIREDIVRQLLRKYITYSDSLCGWGVGYNPAEAEVEAIPSPPINTNQLNNNTMTNEQDGIVYATTGRHDRGIVHSYHRKPNPLDHASGAKHVDIAGVSPRKVPKVLSVDSAGDYKSRFTIGFEIEKNELHRDALKEYPLFCGFETDGSCGYEAVTNILPLLPESKWRDKVFALMDDAEKIIEDAYSPSDRRCGGHITIAVEGLTGTQLMSRIRKNCGIVYALWRHRLKNNFCNKNTNMYPTSREPRSSQRRRTVNGFSRYSVATAKGNCLEFRLPHRVTSVKQLKLRYELFYEIVDFTINNPRTDHAKLLERLRPIIMKMYDNNLDRVDKVIGLASGFREFILTKTITEPIAHVLCPDGAFNSYLSYVDYATDLVNLYDGRHYSDLVNDQAWRERFKRAFPECSLPSMSV